MPRYDARRIEAKWQSYWDEHGTFVTSNAPREGAAGKLYVLDMFPYPSGDGLHVGHPEGYTATDIVSRYWRMKGRHVLHPMGWDAFGLPAEQHAIKTGTHPRETTQRNIDTFRRQLKMLGFSYDWSREISTTDEDYYRWTQWIFLQLYDTWYDPEFEWTGPDGKPRKGKGRPISELPIPDHLKSPPASPGPQASPGRQSGDGGGSEKSMNPEAHAPGSPDDAVRRYQDAHRLAYQSDAPVNWCPALGTVLANEEVTADGKSDRGNHPVERRRLRQWMLRITAYAERLLTELDELDWTESIKLLQRNWIGKSLGAEVDFFVGEATSAGSQRDEFRRWKDARREIGFPAHPGDLVLRVYTTRPDTLFGATYMVVAPEHPIVDLITTGPQQKQVAAYREQVSRKSDLDRTDLAKTKTGVFTGAHAINPVNGEPVPIWIADYVLMSYGTGAIMAVPAHDERDLEFARTFKLPVVEVVEAPEGRENVGFTGDGTAINSGKYIGLPTAQFKQQIAADLAEAGLGRQAVNYRLRDWLFSRQRYWGEPFPLWHELDADGKPTGLTRAVAEDQLPVTLPEMEDYKPKGTPDPPLSAAPDTWLYATAGDGTRLKRETNSMPQWAGSCWYYLRFADPKNDKQFINPDIEKYWLPVDLYIGGAEHAVLHLLYSRFWHKVLFDRGHVSTPEPFQRLVNQGMILGEPELTGFRTAAPAEGEGVYDATTLKPLLQARGHIEKLGALAVDHFQGSLRERWPHYSHLESEGKTCLYSALRNGVIKVSTDRTGLEAVDQHGSLQTVRETIRRLEPTVPADQDPIRWWNNEKGLDATLRMLDAAVESLSTPGAHEWVSAEQVTQAADGRYVDAHERPVEEVKLSEADVVRTEGRLVLKSHPQVAVLSQAHKMSKSRGNVINPDEVVQLYGADSLRLYEMFMGPLEQVKPWSMSGVEGVSRFLGRAWRMIVDERADELQLNPAVQEIDQTDDLDRTLHKTIQAVTEDIEKLSFNTAISRLMEFTNVFTKADPRPKGAMCAFVKLLSPFAPHIAEELWQLLGFEQSIAYEPWPAFDPAKVTEDTIEVPVQINGKLRTKILVPADANPQAMQQIAEASEDVQPHIAGKNVVKVIAVPGRMVNFVVKG